jgi:nitrite reductase/ring-hydroxylating ferredoxin subunit
MPWLFKQKTNLFFCCCCCCLLDIQEGRDVTVFRRHGRYYCLDAVCYHAGGPLIDGELQVCKLYIYLLPPPPLFTIHMQDIEGIACVVCPWHGFLFNLETGDSLYYNMDDKLCSKVGVFFPPITR